MSTGQAPDPDDPVEHYAETMLLNGLTERTAESFKREAVFFEEYVESNEHVDSLGDITPRDVKKIKAIMEKKTDKKEENIKTALGRVKGMYQYFSDRGTWEANPVAIAIEDINWDVSGDPTRQEISLDNLREAINQITHPQLLAMIVLFLKTGIRNGELCNLDLRDVHLDHPLANKLLPEPRDEIANKPDTLFVPSKINKGDEYNGEIRTESNKRNRATKIPIDNELKDALIWWLLMRPPVPSAADPLFVRTSAHGSKNRIGDRHDVSSTRHMIVPWARKRGWHTKGAGPSNNLTPQYFRHYFTTRMRMRLNSSDIGGNDPKFYIKGIRGDTGEDVIDVYTHQWGNYVRETYDKTIYKLLY